MALKELIFCFEAAYMQWFIQIKSIIYSKISEITLWVAWSYWKGNKIEIVYKKGGGRKLHCWCCHCMNIYSLYADMKNSDIIIVIYDNFYVTTSSTYSPQRWFWKWKDIVEKKNYTTQNIQRTMNSCQDNRFLGNNLIIE